MVLFSLQTYVVLDGICGTIVFVLRNGRHGDENNLSFHVLFS